MFVMNIYLPECNDQSTLYHNMQSCATIIWLIIHLSGLINTYPSCLSWEKEHHLLRFICRIADVSKPVTLFDTHGKKYADFYFNDEFYNRRSKHLNVNQANIEEIIFTVDILPETNVDGKWMCCQGDETYQTEVAVSKGIVSATSIQLVGKFINNYNSSKIKLVCFSCREPYGNNAEFLINQQSADTITFSKDTGTCMHIKGNCHPNECVCSNSGNEFIRIFPVNKNENGTLYSCSMQFTDKDKGSVFLKLASIFFNGTEFFNMTTTTTIIKAADVNKGETKSEEDLDANDTVENDNVRSILTIIAVIECGLTTILIAMLYYSTSRKREKKYDKAYKKNEMQDVHLLKQAQTPSTDCTPDIAEQIPGVAINVVLKMNEKLVIAGCIGDVNKQHKLIVMNTKNKQHVYYDLGDKKPYNITLLDDDIVALSYPDQTKADIMNLKTGRLCKTRDIIKI